MSAVLIRDPELQRTSRGSSWPQTTAQWTGEWCSLSRAFTLAFFDNRYLERNTSQTV